MPNLKITTDPLIRVYPTAEGYGAHVFGKVYKGVRSPTLITMQPYGYTWGRDFLNGIPLLWVSLHPDLIYREFTSKWKFKPSYGTGDYGNLPLIVNDLLGKIEPSDLPKGSHWKHHKLRILRKMRKPPQRFTNGVVYQQSITEGPGIWVVDGVIKESYMMKLRENRSGGLVEEIPSEWYTMDGRWASTEFEYLARERYDPV